MPGVKTTREADRQVNDRAPGANPEELDSVVSRYLPAFYRRAFRHLGNVQDAEDAVQDALLSAHIHLSQFRGQAQLSTWVTTIVINAARMQLRRRRQSPSHVPLDQQCGEEECVTRSEMFPDLRPGPEEICRAFELHDRLAQFSKQLPPPQRKAFQLRVIDGLTMAEAARTLGVAEGTVKAQIFRARAKLARRVLKTPQGSRLHAASHRKPDRVLPANKKLKISG